MTPPKRQAQRDLFLVFTLIGTFICLAFIAIGTFAVAGSLPVVTGEIAAGNWRALVGRAQTTMPYSCVFAVVLVVTWFSYRRYRSLLELP